MSRIEEALEKAAKNRANSGGRHTFEKPSVSTPSFVPPKIEPIPVENPFLVTVNEPHSPVSEEYRKLKSLVVSSTRQDELQNCIMVTSALMGEGKSLTSLNLAITLAEELDHTVLLIDADLRKPSLHSYLGLKPEAGLSDCLQNGTDVGEVLIKTGLGKLSLLPAGKAVRNPTELFSSQNARELFQSIKSRYHDRYIIIDTPPTLPFSETRAIGAMVDSLIFVVREGCATSRHVAEALESLKGANLIGVVYNDVHNQAMSDRYGYYYGYDYGGQTTPTSANAREGFFSRIPFLRAKKSG